MYNFDPYSVLLSIATNISVLLMTGLTAETRLTFLRTKPKQTEEQQRDDESRVTHFRVLLEH